MATRPRRTDEQDTVAPQPQVAPPFGAGMPGHDFTLQAVMDLKGSVGELSSTTKSLQIAIEKLGDKVEKLDDKLSAVTHKIYAASVVLVILLGVGGFLVNKAWDMMAMQIARPLPVPVAPAAGTAAPAPPTTAPTSR